MRPSATPRTGLVLNSSTTCLNLALQLSLKSPPSSAERKYCTPSSSRRTGCRDMKVKYLRISVHRCMRARVFVRVAHGKLHVASEYNFVFVFCVCVRLYIDVCRGKEGGRVHL